MIYFIHGPDRLLAKQATAAVAAEFDPEGTNTSWIDGREATLELLIGAVTTASFFGSPRVVIVSDYLGRAKSAAGVESDHSASAVSSAAPRSSPNVKPLLSAVPEQNCLIFLEPGLAAAPAAFKSARETITVIAGDPPRGQALVAWIVDAASRANSSIDRKSAQLLAEMLFPQTWDRKPSNPRFDRPPDLTLMTQEIEKLALGAHPDAITPEHIRELVPSGPDQRVFRFLDAALAGDLRSAMTEFERLAAAGEEQAMLLAQLLGQVELMSVAGAAGARNADSLARDLSSVTPARMAAVLASTKRLLPRTGAALATGVAADRKLKTGRIRHPAEALLDLVLALASNASSSASGRPE